MQRVQLGARMRKTLVKVLKTVADHLDLSLGDLFEVLPGLGVIFLIWSRIAKRSQASIASSGISGRHLTCTIVGHW